ncbi:MAG TPA: aldo/keto reductase [Tepidisphaeraceae bacterium]|nr:aldo/keto reductase [Tepidisphaeraceae bacterium]
MPEKLACGIVGTGSIAGAFAEGLAQSRAGTLAAVGSRSQASADRFGEKYNVARRHPSYEALLADPQVQALYIATPHPAHAEWAIKAARAKKHLLVEKPLGLNAPEAMAIIEAAIENDVFLMEAFMYRVAPQTARLVELIRDQKVIGDVRMIQATYSFQARNAAPDSRLLANALAGGGILDVGCYPISMARLIAGIATGKSFADPIDVKAAGHLGATGVDEWAAAVLRFPGDIIAQVATGVLLNQENACRIYGSDGWILVPNPWAPARNGGSSTILVHRAGKTEPEEITVESPIQIYGVEADFVAANISQRQAAHPGMTWDDSLGNLRALDAWRAAIGLTYEAEKPPTYRTTTVAGSPLAVSPRANMKYGAIAGVDKKVSRLVMGCDNQTTFPHAAVMFDDFFERGGTTFDTAWIYHGGTMERLLGQWIRHRNVRDQVVVIAKGAHTPLCTPRDLTRQLHESLDRLGTDHADIYLMHRDNPEVPVGEFVDVMNEHRAAGRFSAFGGSNWSLDRVRQANEYAQENGRAGFAAVSNNFSLARMVEAPWAGCVSASDADARAWFERARMPLLAWSSQARGFFVPGRAAPDNRDDAELVRCWYSDDNFRRLDRVHEMARRRNVLPINIALAYVLNQPFPTFALVGPRQLSETRTTAAALDLELTPDELGWLNLES